MEDARPRSRVPLDGLRYCLVTPASSIELLALARGLVSSGLNREGADAHRRAPKTTERRHEIGPLQHELMIGRVLRSIQLNGSTTADSGRIKNITRDEKHTASKRITKM